MLRVGSCFSGIGGLDLGLERTGGFKTVWLIENDPHCQKVLRRHWPDVPLFGDIHEVEANMLVDVDIMVGGYPCGPFSVAGDRGGESDARYLWPQMRRLLRLQRPGYVLLENVPGHLSLGFADVLSDLDELRYDAEWGVVPVCSEAGGFGPQLRKRLFVVAHRDGAGLEEREGVGSDIREKLPATIGGSGGARVGQTEPPLGRDLDGLPGRVGEARWPAPLGEPQHEWEPARTCDKRPGRVAELRALGNAVVPQVAEYIGRLLLETTNRA